MPGKFIHLEDSHAKIYLEDAYKKLESYNWKSRSDFRLANRAVYPSEIRVSNWMDGLSSLTKESGLRDEYCLILQLYPDIELDAEELNLDHVHYDYEIILYTKELEALQKTGEKEYLKKINEYKYQNMMTLKDVLHEQLAKLDKKSPAYSSSDRQIKIIDEWIKRYSDWFYKNGFFLPDMNAATLKNTEIPEDLSSPSSIHSLDDYIELVAENKKLKAENIKLDEENKSLHLIVTKLEKKNDELVDVNKSLNRELGVNHDKVIALRKKMKSKTAAITEDELRDIIDRTRKKNGKHNYTKIGEELGVNHETAKKLVIEWGLDNYNTLH